MTNGKFQVNFSKACGTKFFEFLPCGSFADAILMRSAGFARRSKRNDITRRSVTRARANGAYYSALRAGRARPRGSRARARAVAGGRRYLFYATLVLPLRDRRRRRRTAALLQHYILYAAAAAANSYRGKREQVFDDDCDGGGGGVRIHIIIIYYINVPVSRRRRRRRPGTSHAAHPARTAGLKPSPSISCLPQAIPLPRRHRRRSRTNPYRH